MTSPATQLSFLSHFQRKRQAARPFLKWAGGKQQLLAQFDGFFPDKPRRYLEPFAEVRIRGERFPVKSRLHKGLKGFLYNWMFVPAFRILPRPLVRPLGWHLMAYCTKR